MAILFFTLPAMSMIAATGFFDGMHSGHQALLQRVVQLAREQGKESAVITFWPHPRKVLFQQSIPLLSSLEEKKKLISEQGIDQIFVLPFTPTLAQLTAEEFFVKYLIGEFHVTTLVIGRDHHMGNDRMGFEGLQRLGERLGIVVETVDEVLINGYPLSSTHLRKVSLRQEMLAKRAEMSAEERRRWAERIAEKVVSLPVFQEAKEVYCYVDYEKEVGTRVIIEQAWKRGKRVAVPKVEGKEMKFFYVQSFEELKSGYKGILEPMNGVLADASSALVILPAVAVDQEGYRLGYGGGYFDRYLEAHPQYETVALAFEMQVVKFLPREGFDRRVWMVVTEGEAVDFLIQNAI